MPVLYIVGTPIGNLEDVSLRALRTLREVRLIAAEDTRRTKKLLSTYDIKTPMTSYHEHNKQEKITSILGHLEDGDVALVCDAGMPGISDPGHELIVAAIERSFPVIPVPGASVVITALAISGLPAEQFVYLGFLPNRSSARRRFLGSIVYQSRTLIAFEAPHRLSRTLNDMQTVLGDRRIVICRELTKIHEEVFRGTISQAIEHFTEPRGEFTLVIEGRMECDKPQLTGDIEQELNRMQQSGMKAKEAIALIAGETGLSKKELYRAWLNLS